MLAQGVLDAPCAWCSDALVSGERLAQVLRGFAGFAALEVDLAESFEGAGVDERGADVAGDGEGLVKHEASTA
jgi:hypothetical protein